MRKFPRILKTALSLLFCFCFLLPLLSCQKSEEKQPLHILTDVVCCDKFGTFHAAEGLPRLSEYLEYFGFEKGDFEVEILPVDDPERQTRLDSLRTELMTGKGPDVFLLGCNKPSGKRFDGSAHTGNLYQCERLFQSVSSAMENKEFLPLDSFLEQSEFIDTNEIEPAILEAGRTEERQMILPLTVTFPIAVLRRAALQHPESVPESFEDAVSCDESGFRNAYGYAAFYQFTDMFGSLADFSSEKLLFSKEELLHRVQEALSLRNESLFEAADLKKSTDWQGAIPAEGFDGLLKAGSIEIIDTTFWLPGYYDSRQEEGKYDQMLVPLRNAEGGLTAGITSYACINRNTKRPEDAFRVLEFLFRNEVQSCIGEGDGGKGECFQTDILSYTYGVPAKKTALKDWEHSFYQQYVSQYSGKQDNTEAFAEYTALRNEVTHARFYGTLDQELQAMYEACLEAENDEEIEKIVSKAYDTMLMILAES